MRILFIGACPYPSQQGSQVYLRGMARAVAGRGHDVRVACYGHGDGPDDREVATLRAPDVPGYRRVRSGPDLVKPLVDLALARVVARAEADVLHAHGQEGMAVALLARTLRGRRQRQPRIVYNPHTLYEEELPTYLSPMLRPVAARAGKALDDALPRRADACVALSRRTEQALASRRAPRVARIPPGVDPHDFDGVQRRRAGEGRWVVYAGNPDAYQDIDVLLEAMPQVDARLLVVSGTDWGDRLPPRAVQVRPRDWREARDWIAGADVAAVPRRVCAGFPIKLLNHAALGLPTVIAEGSAQGVPGERVVPNGDARAFARALEEALVTGDCVDGPAFIAQNTWTARAEELDALYRSLEGA